MIRTFKLGLAAAAAFVAATPAFAQDAPEDDRRLIILSLIHI